MATRKMTYKLQLLQEIGLMMKKTSLEKLPLQCLEDMSTASLVEFKRWLEPLVAMHPGKTGASHQLGPGPGK